MGDKLTNQDKKFVKELVETGNKQESAQNAYGIEDPNYAGVKASRMLSKDKIQNAIQSLADRIPDDLLEKVHLEGLVAGKMVGETLEPDYAVRHKYLDSGYKLKGAYAPEKSINLDINVDVTDPRARELAEEYENKLKQGL